MNKDKANEILKDLKEAVKALEEKHGVKFSHGNGKYDGTLFSIKVDFVDFDEKSNESGLTPRDLTLQQNMIRSNTIYGKEHIGAKVVIRGDTYEVVGMTSTRNNAKFIIKSMANKTNYEIKQDAIAKQL